MLIDIVLTVEVTNLY